MSYQEIGRRVGLHHDTVAEVVRRTFKANGPQRAMLAREARPICSARSNELLKVHVPKALSGSVAAAELCRKIIDAQARVDGLFGP
jgi:IS30 family transposase